MPSKLISFQVIAGQLKGRKITAPDLGLTRPPLTRNRRAIFDFLWPFLEKARYLDLFSGAGSYMFEAVSRGAAKAVGVEREPKLADSINSHAEDLGVGEKLHCRCDDVFDALPKLAKAGQTFDIIMMAPPQYEGLIDATLASLKENAVGKVNGMIICQHDTSETKKIDFLDYPLNERRKYGNTTFTVLDNL